MNLDSMNLDSYQIHIKIVLCAMIGTIETAQAKEAADYFSAYEWVEAEAGR